MVPTVDGSVIYKVLDDWDGSQNNLQECVRAAILGTCEFERC
jgi:hypothetical protein